MAHRRQEARLGHVGRLGPAPGLVGNRLLLLDLGDQRVLLRAKLQHGESGGVEALGEEDEVDVQADRHRRHRQIEGMTLHEETRDDGQRHGNGAGVEDRHDGGSERHADRQQHDERSQHEHVAGRIGGTQADHGDAAPGETVGQLQPDEHAPPLPDVHLIARQREKVAAGRDHEELDANDRRQPRRRLDHRRPEHRGQREDDGEQGKRDARGQLVARIHGEQFVFEFGLDARPLRQARAHLAQLRLGDGAGILGAGDGLRNRLRVGRCLSGGNSVLLRLGHRMPSCDTGIARPKRPRMRLMKRHIPKFLFNPNKL